MRSHVKNNHQWIDQRNLCYSNSGQVRKTLSVKPADGGSYFFSLCEHPYAV